MMNNLRVFIHEEIKRLYEADEGRKYIAHSYVASTRAEIDAKFKEIREMFKNEGYYVSTSWRPERGVMSYEMTLDVNKKRKLLKAGEQVKDIVNKLNIHVMEPGVKDPGDDNKKLEHFKIAVEALLGDV